ncbi:hypothetical protein GCM10010343_14610 [Streptomyces avidinii]|nr:hypothetical protein GCM10010343_14610 [Streptomyces avidinii]
MRIKDRLITLVRPHGEILGVLALVDARGQADEHTVLALERAATSLALERAHLRNLAEVELRLHRELVDDLLAGTGRGERLHPVRGSRRGREPARGVGTGCPNRGPEGSRHDKEMPPIATGVPRRDGHGGCGRPPAPAAQASTVSSARAHSSFDDNLHEWLCVPSRPEWQRPPLLEAGRPEAERTEPMDEAPQEIGRHPPPPCPPSRSVLFEGIEEIAEARRMARSFLADVKSVHDLPVSERAQSVDELVVSELVTNTRKYAPGPSLLTLDIRDGCVEVTGWDSNPTPPCVLPPRSPTDRPARHGDHRRRRPDVPDRGRPACP